MPGEISEFPIDRIFADMKNRLALAPPSVYVPANGGLLVGVITVVIVPTVLWAEFAPPITVCGDRVIDEIV